MVVLVSVDLVEAGELMSGYVEREDASLVVVVVVGRRVGWNLRLVPKVRWGRDVTDGARGFPAVAVSRARGGWSSRPVGAVTRSSKESSTGLLSSVSASVPVVVSLASCLGFSDTDSVSESSSRTGRSRDSTVPSNRDVLLFVFLFLLL